MILPSSKQGGNSQNFLQILNIFCNFGPLDLEIIMTKSGYWGRY